MTILVAPKYRLKRDRLELTMRAQGYETIKDLAEAAQIEPRKIVRWLKLPTSIKAVDLAHIADVLNVNSDYLIGRNEDAGIRRDPNNLTESELRLLKIARSGKRDEVRDLLFQLIRDDRDLT